MDLVGFYSTRHYHSNVASRCLSEIAVFFDDHYGNDPIITTQSFPQLGFPIGIEGGQSGRVWPRLPTIVPKNLLKERRGIFPQKGFKFRFIWFVHDFQAASHLLAS